MGIQTTPNDIKMLREKVLQQMWQGNMGEQEWRDVETVSLD